MSEEIPPVTGPDQDARMWATIVHVSSFAAFIGIPFANLIAPLVIWLIKRDDSPFVNEHGKEAVNFQICVSIYGVIAGALTIILIGFPLLLALLIYWLVTVIMAAIAANKGDSYRYPFIFRLIN